MRSEKWADILGAAILLLTVFCVVAIPVIGLGIGLGYGLRAIIPGLDLGWAIVTGAVFATGIVPMTARFLWAIQEKDRSRDEDEVLTDEPWIVFPRSLFPPVPSRKRKKRK